MKEVRGEASLGKRRAGGVFVGRERELSVLLAGVDDALEGRGRLFLVAGEPPHAFLTDDEPPELAFYCRSAASASSSRRELFDQWLPNSATHTEACG